MDLIKTGPALEGGHSAAIIRPEANLFTSGKRIPSLDGLRAISVALVVAFHAVNSVVRRNAIDKHLPGKDYQGPSSFLLNGPLGVNIFFVISGFLITHLLLREFSKTGSISLKQFYIRRTFRIWPAFFAYLTVIFILQRLGLVSIKTWGIIAAATFTYNYATNVGSAWVGHSWSLCVEEQFYLLWPLLLLLARPKHALPVAVLLLAVIPLIRLAESVTVPLPPQPGTVSMTSAAKSTLPHESYPTVLRTRMWQMGHTRMDMLMFGCLLALLADKPWFVRLIRTLYRFQVQWIAVAYLLAAPMIWKWLSHIHLDAALRNTTEGLSIAFLIAVSVLFYRNCFGRFLNWNPIVHLGQISYSLYLWHELFMVPQNRSWTGMFPMNLICALVMAELSRRFVESPFLAWRERKKSERTTVDDEVLIGHAAAASC